MSGAKAAALVGVGMIVLGIQIAVIYDCGYWGFLRGAFWLWLFGACR